jgi:hypothetical protein
MAPLTDSFTAAASAPTGPDQLAARIDFHRGDPACTAGPISGRIKAFACRSPAWHRWHVCSLRTDDTNRYVGPTPLISNSQYAGAVTFAVRI